MDKSTLRYNFVIVLITYTFIYYKARELLAQFAHLIIEKYNAIP